MKSLLLISALIIYILVVTQNCWKSSAFCLSQSSTFNRKVSHGHVFLTRLGHYSPKGYIQGFKALFNGGNSDDLSRSFYERNVDRTCLRRFLTQRSIQSFMFLCQEFRDPHTIRWLEDFGNTTDLVYYHGTGAIDPVLFKTWDAYFLQMMEKPDDFIVVQARRRGRGTGGWSKDNPYLQERFVEYRIDISPPSLVTRILSVREQLAREWIKDLGVIIRMENEIMDSYFENLIRERDEEVECSALNSTECELLIDSQTNNKPASFDRNAIIMIRNSIAFEEQESSPLRMGSFDLLMLLATHESIHRILRDYKNSGTDSAPIYEWFRDFYVQRAATFFDGPQQRGRADDFLEELLLTPPTVKQVSARSSTIIDPLGVAEKIIRTRCEVAQEWKDMLSETPNDHIGLRRKLLSRQVLGSTGGQSNPESSTTRINDSSLYDESDTNAFM